jgi:aspartate/methionine/tyrosine aminotransferase
MASQQHHRNPTGVVFPAKLCQEIATMLQRPENSHVYIISDDIYEQLLFDAEHISFASLDGMRERS